MWKWSCSGPEAAWGRLQSPCCDSKSTLCILQTHWLRGSLSGLSQTEQGHSELWLTAWLSSVLSTTPLFHSNSTASWGQWPLLQVREHRNDEISIVERRLVVKWVISHSHRSWGTKEKRERKKKGKEGRKRKEGKRMSQIWEMTRTQNLWVTFQWY